jgi:hypothetical protein
MPLDVVRVRDSDLAAEESPEACWAALLLWCAAWHQVPAGSIPDSDQWQAKQAGYVARGRIDKAWEVVRAGALRNWVKCSDGRLYHPVVAEKAIVAWTEKQAQRARTKAATEAREAKRRAQQLQRDDERDVARNVERDDKRDVHQGIGIGTGIGTGNKHASHAPRVPAEPPQQATSPPTPTQAGAICRLLRQHGIPDTNPGHAKLLALLEAGATEAEFLGLTAEAQRKAKPFAWLIEALTRQREEVAQRAAGMHRGRMPTSPSTDRQSRQLATAGALVRGGMDPLPTTTPPQPEAIDVESRTIAP